MNAFRHLTSENFRIFFLFVLFFSMPFSIAGDDFAILGLYLVTLYRLVKKQESLTYTPIMAGMGMMIFGALISSLFSDDILQSLTYFRRFWRLGLPFMILLAFRNRPIDRFIKVLAVVASLVAIYAVIQYFTGLDVLRSEASQASYRSTWGVWYAVGVFSHHLTFGGVFLLLFAMFLPNLFSRDISPPERLLFMVASATCFAAVWVSMGRSIWLGAMGALAVFIFVFLGRRRSIMAVAVILLLAGGFYLYQGTQNNTFFKKTEIGRRMASITLKSNRDRLFMWKASLQVISNHPILGLGPNRRERMDPYYDNIRRKEKHRFQHRPHVGVHNIYLQNWIDFGLLGMIGYLIWWGTLLFQIMLALRKGPVTGRINAQLSGFLMGLVGIMIAGFFENNFRDGEVQTTILVVMGLSLVLLEKAGNRPLEINESE